MKGGGIVPSSLLFVRGCLDLEDEIGSNTIHQRMTILLCLASVCRKGDRNLKREHEFLPAFYMDECRQNLGSRTVRRRFITTGQSDPAIGERVIFIAGYPDLPNQKSLSRSDDGITMKIKVVRMETNQFSNLIFELSQGENVLLKLKIARLMGFV